MMVVRKDNGSTANRNAVASNVATANPEREPEPPESVSTIAASTATFEQGIAASLWYGRRPCRRRGPLVRQWLPTLVSGPPLRRELGSFWCVCARAKIRFEDAADVRRS